MNYYSLYVLLYILVSTSVYFVIFFFIIFHLPLLVLVHVRMQMRQLASEFNHRYHQSSCSLVGSVPLYFKSFGARNVRTLYVYMRIKACNSKNREMFGIFNLTRALHCVGTEFIYSVILRLMWRKYSCLKLIRKIFINNEKSSDLMKYFSKFM